MVIFQNEHEVAPDTARGRMWPLQALPPLESSDDIIPAVIAEKIAGESQIKCAVFFTGSN